ncbi:MAG TPA: AAA family ATPase [Frankiaceae bacterium]|nr:AAA family ATPase [Frankiaceae bacterium]
MTAAAGVVETHTATLFFTSDRVYKVKKHLDLGFVDFRSYADRRQVCLDEVALNRRLAPDVYLGVASVTDVEGQPCDSVVVMRRMPDDRRLSSLLSTAGSGVRHDLVRAVARTVAAFHARCDTSPEIVELGSWSSVRGLWQENAEAVQRFAGRFLDPLLLNRVSRLANQYLRGREPLFRLRQERGLVRDGHGDLLCDDIYCLDDGPRILDCLEFDRRLRIGDVLADVAFLGMDLERLGHPDLAHTLFAEYGRFSGEHHPRSLQHFYVAYRALVRSKVSCIRAEQMGTAGGPLAEAAVRLAGLAEQHLHAGRMRMVLVGGLPGTGKSSVAAGLADANPTWTLVRSDQIRKEMAGIDGSAAAPFGQGLYSAEQRRHTYGELLERARMCLEQGENVLLDASGTQQEQRDAAHRVAESTGAELQALHCVVPELVQLDRLARRRGDVSDADGAVAVAVAREADPWPEAVQLSTDAPLPDVVANAAALLADDR